METSLATPEHQALSISNRQVWAGRILGGLAIAFLLFDCAIKLAAPPFVREAHEQLGYPGGIARALGALLLGGVILHVIPRTSFLGAVLLTGYLGGAVATHVRIGNPLLSHVLFPIYVAVFVWGGLWLRDGRVRELLPFRK